MNQDKTRNDLLFKAIENKNLNLLKNSLSPNDNLNIFDETGTSLLTRAILSGDNDILLTILSHKNIDLNIKDSDGLTSLDYLYEKNYSKNRKLLERLLEIKADVNKFLDPLLLTFIDDPIFLIEHKIDVNKDFGGTSALQFATLGNKLNVIDLLLKNGAKLDKNNELCPTSECKDIYIKYMRQEKKEEEIKRPFKSSTTKDIDIQSFDRYDPSKKILITKDGRIFKFNKTLGHGSYGVVSSFHNDELNQDIALKITNDVREYNSVNELVKTGCNILESKSLNHQGREYYIVMKKMDGDLKSIIDTIQLIYNNKQKLSLIYKLLEALICLKKVGFCYTDLKAANILYVKTDKSTYDIRLGDLGSICKESDTSVCVYSDRVPGIDKSNDKYCVAMGIWTCALLLLQMYVPSLIFEKFRKRLQNPYNLNYELVNLKNELQQRKVNQYIIGLISFMLGNASQITYTDIENRIIHLISSFQSEDGYPIKKTVATTKKENQIKTFEQENNISDASSTKTNRQPSNITPTVSLYLSS